MIEKGLHQLRPLLVRRCMVQCRIAALSHQTRIGALVQKKNRKFLVATGGGYHQWRHAILVPAFIHIGTGLQQGTARLHVSLLRSEQEWSEIAVRAGANVRSMFDQQFHDFRVLVGDRPHQGCLTAPRFLHVHVGPMLEQGAGRVHVAFVHGRHERRLTREERRIRIRFRTQEKFDHAQYCRLRRRQKALWHRIRSPRSRLPSLVSEGPPLPDHCGQPPVPARWNRQAERH